MGFLDGLKQGLNIGGPKVVPDEKALHVNVNDHDVEIGFTIVNQQSPVHVANIKLMLYTRVPSAVTDQHNQDVLYKQTVYDNGGRGWDIGADESLPLKLRSMLNDQAFGADIASLLRRSSPSNPFGSKARGPHWPMSVTIYVDLPKVAFDPQANVQLYVYP